ncbi:hypothetical protein AX16_004851 [Volvariella volvacea WC 439]|nr:hypothetical protein AX16_004851 [Volvariella volvacea WC 439]
MKLRYLQACLGLLSHALTLHAIYVPYREYAGSSFFDGWDYYGFYDNTTWGNVTYVDRANATEHRLTYVNDAGNAIIRVDNESFVEDGPLVYRNSVRLTTHEAYGVGSLWVIDLLHLPYGCSVWPAFWSLGVGEEWPYAGEIDIIEGVNMMGNNQMALHADVGCAQGDPPGQTGQTLEGDCSQDRGCVVRETKPNSFGSGFAQAGGGVWAVQFDVSGIFIWFWSRPDIPADVRDATPETPLDTAIWGPPSASYPAFGCNTTEYFGAQQLILLITLCGAWAGVPDIYSSTCPGTCYASNIIGPGSPTYDNAYFEIRYLRIYHEESISPPVVSGTASPSPSSTLPPPPPGSIVVSTDTALTSETPSTGLSPLSGASTTPLSVAFSVVVSLVAIAVHYI